MATLAGASQSLRRASGWWTRVACTPVPVTEPSRALQLGRLLAFLVALCAGIPCRAGQDSCPGDWDVYTPGGAGGLSDVLNLPDGTLVVATKTDGLRFLERGAGGVYAWRTVKVSARGTGLASNKTTSLALFLGELWVGTQDAGISIFNFKDRQWRTIDTANTAQLPTNTILRLCPIGPDPSIRDPGDTDEMMWVCTPSGAVRYSFARVGQLSAWIWSLFNSQDGLPYNYIRDIAVQFRNGTRYTWFATDQLLVRWDGNTFVDYLGVCNSLYTAERILVDNLNRVWFAGLQVVPALQGPGEGGGGGGVLVPIGLCRVSYNPVTQIASWTSFDQQYGYDMSLDDSGRLWTSMVDEFGSPVGGGFVHDQGSWCIFRSTNSPLSGNQVSAVHAAGELTWYAQSLTNLLDTFTPNWSRLHKSRLNVVGEIGPLAFTPLGTVVGGEGGISYSFPGAPLPWPRLSLTQDAGIPVSSLLVEWPYIWVGLGGSGLRKVELNPATGAVVNVEAFRAAEGLASDDVRSILRDGTGRLWIATGGGLSLRGNGYWLNFTTQSSPLPGDHLTSLCLGEAENLWIGTEESGISVLDPNAVGSGAWRTWTTADGLPSNAIRALARSADGKVWAATAAGAAEHALATGQWVVHNVQTGALPGNSCNTLAIDSSNRVWVGTTAGLAWKVGAVWKAFHPTSSTLGSDLVSHLATRGEELWAATGETIAIRKNVPGPIGNFPPEITSFTPAVAGPGAEVTVNGKNFDARGAQYNEVRVGFQEVTGGVAAQPAEILSVTSTKIVFKVPDRADTGPVRVTSHCLETESSTELTVGPAISNVSPICASLGAEIKIFGAGFYTSGGCVVRFGNGPWRSPAGTPGDNLGPNLISIRLRPGDETGKVQVRNNDGATATSADTVVVGSLSSPGHYVVQGVEGLRLIWGKRTIVGLQLKAQGCPTQVSGGKIYWKKKDGTFQLAGKGYGVIWDENQRIELADAPPLSEDFTTLEYVGEFASARSGWEDFFPLSQLDGVRCVVQNNKVDILTVDIPRSELPFKEIKTPLVLRSIGVFDEDGGTSWSKFWADATDSLHETARIMPQPDFGPFYGDASWMGIASSYFTVETADLRSNFLGADVFNDYTHITGMAGDLLEPGFGQFAMALIDPALYVDHPDESDPTGKAPLGPFYDGATAVSYNFEGQAAPTITQELCHMLGLVDSDAENHDDQNDGHSRYDEGEDYEEGTECALSSFLTYSDAVLDQLGLEYPRLRWITEGAPYRLGTGSCSEDRAKSSMSYVPDSVNWNSFLEPVDYEAVLDYLDELHARAGSGGGGGGLEGGTVLSLRGVISMGGEVQVTLCYLDSSGAPGTTADPESHFAAVVRDGAGAELLSLPFRVDFHAHGDVNASTAFQVRVPFPDDARKLELRREGDVIWSKTRSPRAPVVSFTAPAGGSFSGDQQVPVSWTASDEDQDSLQFALDYSADGGATWIKLPQYLLGTAYSWRPGYLPPSASARLRIRASDGFNTTTALSAPFRLSAAAPVVAIRSPRDGAMIPEGSNVDLVAESLTSFGVNTGTFAWTIDGAPLPGSERGTEFQLSMVGAHVLKVILTDPAGLQAAAQITVTVYPDFDRDGLPNDWEQAHGLNPLDTSDAAADPDGDDLVNKAEYRLGTDPQVANTDGDAAPDGVEVAARTDPLSPDSAPPTGPVLQVGPFSVGFTVEEGSGASDPRSFFVHNVGVGSMTWSVENDLPWLQVTPSGGTAPTQVTLVAIPGGLGIGTYTGQIVFTAPGALQSPRVVLVKLSVKPEGPHVETHFSRGDANADRSFNISDPSATLTYLFLDASRAPPCLDAADSNDDGVVNITDAVYSLNYLFLGGSAPPAPYPDCGHDETADAASCMANPACD